MAHCHVMAVQNFFHKNFKKYIYTIGALKEDKIKPKTSTVTQPYRGVKPFLLRHIFGRPGS